jgi:hypothetical protein
MLVAIVILILSGFQFYQSRIQTYKNKENPTASQSRDMKHPMKYKDVQKVEEKEAKKNAKPNPDDNASEHPEWFNLTGKWYAFLDNKIPVNKKGDLDSNPFFRIDLSIPSQKDRRNIWIDHFKMDKTEFNLLGQDYFMNYIAKDTIKLNLTDENSDTTLRNYHIVRENNHISKLLYSELGQLDLSDWSKNKEKITNMTFKKLKQHKYKFYVSPEVFQYTVSTANHNDSRNFLTSTVAFKKEEKYIRMDRYISYVLLAYDLIREESS